MAEIDKRIEGDVLLTILGTPEIFRSYIMGYMLETPFCKIVDDRLTFSIRDLGNVFVNTIKFKFLFPNADQSTTTSQTEESRELKSIGNDFANSRENGPNRIPG